MKTAAEYTEEAIEQWAQANDSNPKDYQPVHAFIERAMKDYAKEVTKQTLDELADNLDYGSKLATGNWKYNIKTP